MRGVDRAREFLEERGGKGGDSLEKRSLARLLR